MTIIELDARNRASLGALATAKLYTAEVDDDGTITMTPAVVMSAIDAALLRRPDILAVIDESMASRVDAGRPTRTKRA